MNQPKFFVKTARSILGTRVLYIRFPHQKKITEIERINNHFPVTYNGLTNIHCEKFYVYETIKDIEEWTFVIKVDGDDARCEEVIDSEGKNFFLVNLKEAGQVPPEVLRYSIYPKWIKYNEIKENSVLVDCNKIIDKIEIVSSVYEEVK